MEYTSLSVIMFFPRQGGYAMGMQDVPYPGGQPLNMQVDINVHVHIHCDNPPANGFGYPPNGQRLVDVVMGNDASAAAPINPAGFAAALDVVLNRAAFPAPPNQMMIDDAGGDTDWTIAENQQVMIRDIFEEPVPPGPNARNGAWADYCYLYYQIFPNPEYSAYTRQAWLRYLNDEYPDLHLSLIHI